MRGRPPCYTPELAQRLLDGISGGRSLCEVCADAGMPSKVTVRKWVREDVEEFAKCYRRAQAIGQRIRPLQLQYTREIADRVIEGLTASRTLAAVLDDPRMPSRKTICVWVATDRDGFAARYRLARQIGYARTRQVACTPELEELILVELMCARTLTDTCRDPEMPALGSVYHWLAKDPDGFGVRYRCAREIGAEVMADQTVDIADDREDDWIRRTNEDGTAEVILDPARIRRARQRIETRRWRIARILPRTYGDRVDLAARPDRGSSWADLLRAVDGKTQEPPKQKREES
jgi:hypothetical protein